MMLNRNICCSQCRSWVQNYTDLWADPEELLHVTTFPRQADASGLGFSILQFYSAYQVVLVIQLHLFSCFTAQTAITNPE